MGSLERETRREQHLERQARLAELNEPIEERMPRFEEQEPVANIGVNFFRAGQDVQFELGENHPLRAAAAARNRVPSAALQQLLLGRLPHKLLWQHSDEQIVVLSRTSNSTR